MDSYTNSKNDRFINKKMTELGYTWENYTKPNGSVGFHANDDVIVNIAKKMLEFKEKYKINLQTCSEKINMPGISKLGCLNVDSINAALGTNDTVHIAGN